MKKIGVITFLTTKDNYGQVLQAFALQHVLKQMGCNPFVINYQKRPNRIWYKNLIISIIKFLYPNWRKTTSDIELEKKNEIRDFDSFIAKNIVLSTKKYQSLKQLQNDPPLADIYITGSDQVWAQLISDKNNRAYFLDFGKKTTRRIAYAPSFAMDRYPEELIPQLSQLLKTFDVISVREKNGIDICKNAGRNDTQIVLDPTLLLNSNIYKNIFNINNRRKTNYLFIYCINILTANEIEWNTLQQYAQKIT